MNKYRFWLESGYFDQDTKNELLTIMDDKAEIEDRFFKDLEFGTGGLRGIIGAGTNRINVYTVRKTTQGFADYLKLMYGAGCFTRGVVIAYDSRKYSDVFSLEAAKVLAGNRIKTYLFDGLRPTPELSYAVRRLDAVGGIVVTASHNPKEYNGYKVYGADGAQLSGNDSKKLESVIGSINDITGVNLADEQSAKDSGLLEIIGSEIDDSFINDLKSLRMHPELPAEALRGIRILYTPLNGAGNKLVRRLLSETGFDVDVVNEQELPDADFSTVPYPNPEDIASFEYAIRRAGSSRYDLLLATDPDSDRLGVVVRGRDGYVQLTGNQTGCLLMEYILANRRDAGSLYDDAFVVKTIVSTEMAAKIAERHGVTIVEVLTGFKYIGEQIKLLDDNGNKRFIFGFEESIGYLAGKFSRDKDAVGTSMLVAEMAACYGQQGMTLLDALDKLYSEYGFYMTRLINKIMSQDKAGMEKMNMAMNSLRTQDIERFGDFRTLAVRDYLKGTRKQVGVSETELLDLPESDVLFYELEDNAWICFRPSGTEPKIKIYYEVQDIDRERALMKFNSFGLAIQPMIDKMFT